MNRVTLALFKKKKTLDRTWKNPGLLLLWTQHQRWQQQTLTVSKQILLFNDVPLKSFVGKLNNSICWRILFELVINFYFPLFFSFNSKPLRFSFVWDLINWLIGLFSKYLHLCQHKSRRNTEQSFLYFLSLIPKVHFFTECWLFMLFIFELIKWLPQIPSFKKRELFIQNWFFQEEERTSNALKMPANRCISVFFFQRLIDFQMACHKLRLRAFCVIKDES